MSKTLLTFCLTLMLAACGTSVPLSEVPVTDGTVKSVGVNAPIGSGSTGVVASNSVAQVEVGNPAAEVGAPAGPNVVYFDYFDLKYTLVCMDGEEVEVIRDCGDILFLSNQNGEKDYIFSARIKRKDL